MNQSVLCLPIIRDTNKVRRGRRMHQISNPRWWFDIKLPCYETIYCSIIFKRNGPTPASFYLFSFFSNINFTERNCRFHWDSNSDCWSRRQASWPLDHHHDPAVGVGLMAHVASHLREDDLRCPGWWVRGVPMWHHFDSRISAILFQTQIFAVLANKL